MTATPDAAEIAGRLLALADRCEAAMGADRELDAEVWLASVPGTTRWETRYTHKPTGKECVIDETRENGRLIVVPAYTANLDAALTLVPKGGFWRVGNDGKGGDPALFKAQVLVPGQFVSPKGVAVADSGPLALVAAALRARAALTPRDGAK